MRSLRAWDDQLEKMLYANIEQFDDMLGYRFSEHFETAGPIYQWGSGLEDKKGTEIYEGDIVRIEGHPFEGPMKINGNYEVGYNDRMELCCGSLLLHRELPYVTVVGNMIEHPHLLNLPGEVDHE
ncbi:YopX family protein [Paenibacillus sp. Marseille-Q4541]|uniref:YopX family protein n=1 Tax=Paenibacillus sp. Marseille-Q4541 TaxID=2831522 RepID=UPI001BA8C7F6|nr:YopX family protein [Paenibacillus sp. Marseille-Q4541]